MKQTAGTLNSSVFYPLFLFFAQTYVSLLCVLYVTHWRPGSQRPSNPYLPCPFSWLHSFDPMVASTLNELFCFFLSVWLSPAGIFARRPLLIPSSAQAECCASLSNSGILLLLKSYLLLWSNMVCFMQSPKIELSHFFHSYLYINC